MALDTFWTSSRVAYSDSAKVSWMPTAWSFGTTPR